MFQEDKAGKGSLAEDSMSPGWRVTAQAVASLVWPQPRMLLPIKTGSEARVPIS